MIIRYESQHEEKKISGGSGFSLVEILIVVTILMITASTITLKSNAFMPTAKSEAEKIAAYIHSKMRRADRIHDVLIIKCVTDKGKEEARLVWYRKGDSKREYYDIAPVSSGFTIKHDFALDLTEIQYSPLNNTFNCSGHITVTRDSDKSYYTIIFYDKGGRIRTAHDSEYIHKL